MQHLVKYLRILYKQRNDMTYIC